MPPASRRTLEATIRRHPVPAFSIGLAVLVAAVFFDPLFLGKTFVSRDLVPFFLPIEKAVHDAWSAGHVPLLLPEVSFGRPLAANPNTGAFYPLRIAMAALPFPVAFKLFPVLHVWIAGIGAYLLARFLGISFSGAAIAGVGYALCGPTLGEIMYPDFLPGLAAVPFVIVASGRLARRSSRWSLSIFALSWGWILLAGDVFTAGLALLGAALLTIQETPRERRLLSLSRLGLATIPGFLLAGIQILPALLFIPQTVRGLGRFPVRVALMWSVSLWRFLELFLPFPFGNPVRHGASWGDALWSGKSVGFFNTLYPGAFASLALLVARPPRGRRLFLYGFLVISAVLSVAGFYCPKNWLETASPIPLRYPEKLMVGFALCAALLAGVLADSLIGKLRSRASAAALAMAAMTAIAAFVVKVWPSATARFVLAHWSNAPGGAAAAAAKMPGDLAVAAIVWLLAGVLVLRSVRARSRAGAAAILLALVAADLGANRFRFVTTGSEKDVYSPPRSAAVVRAVDEGSRYGFLPIEDYFRGTTDREGLTTDVAAMFGIAYSFNQDYDDSDLYRVDLARRGIYRDAGLWKGLPRYLAAFAARSALVEKGRMPNGFGLAGPAAGERWVVLNPAALPMARMAPAVREVRDPSEAYAAVNSDEVDLTRETVVETGRPAVNSLSGGTCRELRSDGAGADYETGSPGPGRLVFARAWYPYREASVDGNPVDIVPANLCWSSVAVPPGRHRVLVEEKLPGGTAGPLLSVCGILTVIFLAYRKEGNETAR